MTVTDKLKSLLDNCYETEDEDVFKVELFEGMTVDEINNFRDKLPSNFLPKEIETLLRFCKGFQFLPLEEVRFDNLDCPGFKILFDHSIQLAGDGYGNFWYLDIDSKGNWGHVYYVCHDPAVVVKHSENLTDFIGHLHDFALNGAKSNLDIIHEKIVFDIWKNNGVLTDQNLENYQDKLHIMQLPNSFWIADLTSKPIQSGFPWAISGWDARIIKVVDEPIWIIEK